MIRRERETGERADAMKIFLIRIIDFSPAVPRPFRQRWRDGMFGCLASSVWIEEQGACVIEGTSVGHKTPAMSSHGTHVGKDSLESA